MSSCRRGETGSNPLEKKKSMTWWSSIKIKISYKFSKYPLRSIELHNIENSGKLYDITCKTCQNGQQAQLKEILSNFPAGQQYVEMDKKW